MVVRVTYAFLLAAGSLWAGDRAPELTLERLFTTEDFKVKGLEGARWLPDGSGYELLEDSTTRYAGAKNSVGLRTHPAGRHECASDRPERLRRCECQARLGNTDHPSGHRPASGIRHSDAGIRQDYQMPMYIRCSHLSGT